MNSRFVTERPVVIAALSSLVALGCVGASIATSRAQTDTKAAQNAPDSAALQRKVEALEKQVDQLKKQVEELKQNRMTFSLVQPTRPNSTLPLQRWQTVPAEPPLGTPFRFNGRTYYRSLLETQAQANTNATISPGSGSLSILPARSADVAAPAAGPK